MIILNNISLQPFNTFKMAVNASSFVAINNTDELVNILKDPQLLPLPKLVLGGGSNILFTKNFPGLVIKNQIKGITIQSETESDSFVTSGGGEVWHDLVLYCIDHNLGGMENLSLIPGTVGASPIQNIGAYGVELKDIFESLEAIHLQTGEIKIFTKEDCHFGYRESIFKKALAGQYLISAVTFKLTKHPVINTSYGAIAETLAAAGISTPGIRDISNAVCKIRKSKLPDPAVIGNAGSFFKNPEISLEEYNLLNEEFPSMPHYKTGADKVKIPAGWLNEQCGWKGKQIGNTGVHKEQALVLVNYGNASGHEVQALSEQIQRSVFAKFGIRLETEVNIL